ncbi:MAG: hypothetical protein J1F32_07160 [Erysipelotrichales bacterium]|nr:hypothetical protein [Erysipelotrichales bacterium]
MIRPNKFTNPFNCIIYDSYTILQILSKKKQLTNKKLHRAFINKLGDDSDPLYVLSLDFLFLLDLINYNVETDIVELKNEIK